MSTHPPRPWIRSYAAGVPSELELPTGSLVDIVTESAERYPHQVALEFFGRSTSYAQLADDVEKAAEGLRRLGVRIALDDFGTGYSSLYHLRELQFDKLKIDRSYVESMRLSSERAKLVDAIIALGSSLGLLTTAEGIESGTSVDWLAGQGCTYGQGYLFGRPMNKATTDGLLTQWSDEEGRIVIAPSLSETSELAERELVALAPPPALRQAAA